MGVGFARTVVCVLLVVGIPSLAGGRLLPAAGVVIDGTGQVLGPVVSLIPSSQVVAFSVSVGGAYQVLAASRDRLFGAVTGAVFFDSTDCTGSGFVERGGHILPGAVVFGLQLYVESPLGLEQTRTPRSAGLNGTSTCQSIGPDPRLVTPTSAPIDVSGFVPPFSVRAVTP